MTRMLDLGNVLELINDRLHNRSTTEQDAIGEAHQAVLHVLAQLGNQLDVEHRAQGLR